MSGPALQRHLWLVAALLLLMAAGWLTWMAERRPTVVARSPQFPSYLREPERQRIAQRQTLPERRPRTPNETPPPRDPLLAALPRDATSGVMIVELNALRHSPVGDLLVDCLRKRGGDALDKLQREAGLDPLEDLDRVALTDKGIVVSGFFGKTNWGELTKDMQEVPWGAGGHVYSDERKHEAIGVWHDQLLVVRDSPDEVRQALDQIEGRGAAPPPPLPESKTFGEAYGVMPGSALKAMLGAGGEDIGARLAELANKVEFHLDAQGDVALVAQVRGGDADGLSDLAKSIGGALSLARMKAKAEGDRDFAELLEFARVVPGTNGFSIEVALPLAVLERQLAWCRADGGVAPK